MPKQGKQVNCIPMNPKVPASTQQDQWVISGAEILDFNSNHSQVNRKLKGEVVVKKSVISKQMIALLSHVLNTTTAMITK
jgi:hypothetical protein